MSDDKREKLREYLRNNRPKNNINLGKKSNDKENSNKNLEKDSNLDNSQISNNKINSNKRDYDKEPLIVKNYLKFVNIILIFVYFFLLFLFLIFIGVETRYRSGGIGIGMFTGLSYVLFQPYDKNLTLIIFDNQFIKYQINNEWKKIKISNIKEINKNCSNSYLDLHKIKISNSLLIASIALFFSTCILVKDYKTAFVIVILPVISYFLARFILFAFINKTIFGYKVFNSVAIYKKQNFLSKDENYINILPNKKNLKEIEIYFVNKLNINLENQKCYFSVFKKNNS
ncbi:hypothetical protein [Campylobacter ureolyticus]|uniref:hypothetical protein n=1 Tax=Campylobacter ureolyticus TaxID=827 RepID=UPI001FC810A8|nr:hypothetical protein [Campylobacter ureolyticus]MCZ6106031.1 hypothetical protein [Campylobacter ureolyticus]MCZ6158658.1 hypothetical protein [Campylobacter ureolyticus]GKH60458.1 hypothetical protein CE91St25_07940 [Campylobacter ureolyticus]